ncbi:MAG: Stk1 family PASTA domain-containing Ser/Thr kinase [Leucobacter sp.]
MTPAPTDPLIGHTLDGRYVIRSRIARGGMAMVYLANDLRLERRVAVKVMHPHLAEDQNFTRRFEQEARSAAMLAHPNVVNVFDQGQDSGHFYLVMEHLPGITLRDLLKQQQSLTAEQALDISEAVLSGLAAAHRAGIVHRDLKPENVLLADDGRIKIGDFGLARAVSANTTTGQALLGTIAYLSPELVTRGIADARADIYAFGIMLFEMLTGQQPFKGEQPMQIAYQHAHSDVPAPSTLSAEATPELDELVRWTTQRDRDARPRDAAIVLERLHELHIPPGSPGSTTRVLPLTDLPGVTPSTTVLDDAQRDELAAASTDTPTEPEFTPESPLDRAAASGNSRAKLGRVIAALIILAAVLAGGAGWWFGQGPGSQVTIPQVEGEPIAAVEQSFAEVSLTAEIFECSSVDIAQGDAVKSEPAAGERVDRNSTVRVCKSMGPEMLPVPTLVGVPVGEAEVLITEAGFTFGEITERRFGDEDRDVVIAALDESGDGLGETYAEQAPIDLIVSAGSLPGVSGQSVADATQTLGDVELSVDSGLNTETHNDEVPKGSVISAVYHTDPVKPGDTVGLEISLGPELFEIPSTTDMTVREAMNALESAGFSPATAMPELLWDNATVTGTDPDAGERVPAGADVQVRATLTL